MSKIKTLFSEEQLRERVAEMGREITKFFKGSDLTVVVLANGGVPFAADLMRKIDMPLFMDTLSVASYHADKRGDELVFRSSLKLSPKGRRILVLDEVLDSGRTLKGVINYLLKEGATDVHTAVIVRKDDIKRGPDCLETADWIGFNCPNQYLIGYGLDSNELYRNLPFIGVLED